MTYRERLLVPLWWWLFGCFLVFGMVLAVWSYWGDAAGAAAGAGLGVGLIALLTGIGSPVLVVDEQGISVGKATLAWPWVGDVASLDADAARCLLGVDANPAAWLLTRPWVGTCVRIEVDDAADPHPYWVVSTRHPGAVVAAVNAHRQRVAS